MITMEERAEKYADKAENILEYSDGWEEHTDYDYVKKAYIHGATEQREIDHENAVRTYCRFCSHQCENYPHEDCQVLIEYRQALEE